MYNTGIYRKLDYNKNGTYIIKQDFKNGAVHVQKVRVKNETNGMYTFREAITQANISHARNLLIFPFFLD